MGFEVEHILSIGSGSENEDRAGAAPPFAWVIDGATDVLPERLTSAPSDASWFAAAMNDTMCDLAAAPPSSLIDVPEIVAAKLAPLFHAASRRPASGPEEHPSASAIVIRILNGELEYVSLGDCTLIVEDGYRWTQIGVSEEDAGDRWVADALQGKSDDERLPKKPLTRTELWPLLQAQRARMNIAAGYGIFSITAPPRSMIRHGAVPVSPGARVLLASDGLLRLVDVFKRYNARRLFASAWSTGLVPLFDELRATENGDADCTRFPRAKTSDDTTALLARITA